MLRADTFLTIVVSALALFVGSAIVRGRTTAHAPQTQVLSTEVALAPTPPSTIPNRHADVTALDRNDITRVPDAAQMRARIAAAGDTYIADMLDDDGLLVRWPDRRDRGLRVWVQSMSPVQDWDLRYAQMARDAFAEWSDGLPARLDFVLDSADSDVRIVWIERFPPEAGLQVGRTQRMHDAKGWLVKAEISVAVHDSSGRAIPPASLAGVMRHEAGHALGLGHSKDPKTKMYPIEMTNTIMPSDRATLRLLYELTPGSVR